MPKNVYELITNRIIKQLEAGVAPWHKPWRVRGKNGFPRNLVTGHEYRGINLWVLLSSEYPSPFWMTYRQAHELGGHVRQGQQGLPVVYWKFGKREVLDGDEIIEKPSVLCRYYVVFNQVQVEGLRLRPTDRTEEKPQLQPIEACERVVAEWKQKPSILCGSDCACYNKLLDCVRIPALQSFDSTEYYYSVLFHELVHSTGHPNRLNRSTLTDFERFGDATYSREELVAELGSAFLSGYCGIENTVSNSAAYIASWLEALKNDSRLVLIAASQAQKAADLILNISPALTTP
jgi:antirestriction protein ArdC